MEHQGAPPSLYPDAIFGNTKYDTRVNCYFLVPGLSEQYRSGGLMVIQDVARMVAALPVHTSTFITTHEHHAGGVSAEDFFSKPVPEDALFFVTWGPLVKQHIRLIRQHARSARIVYYAQSFGWGMNIPRDVFIVCVSRFVMAQFALHYPGHNLAYIPPPLHPCFSLGTGERDIDVLVHKRKQNSYCLEKLLPALISKKLRMEILEGWMPQKDFAEKLQRTKVFLYITAPHKAGFFRRLPGEGFGLPALEAVACGAMVGSNLLGGVTDFLTPGENCLKLESGDLAFDVEQIINATETFAANQAAARQIIETYSEKTTLDRWGMIL